MLWFMGLTSCVTLFYRQLFSRRPAIGYLAALLFAVSSLHWEIALICMRGYLVSGIAGVLGLLAYVRARERAWRWGLPLSAFGFLASLLAGESSLQLLGYVVAYELVAAQGRVWKRVGLLAGAAFLAAAYFALRAALGYGTNHEGKNGILFVASYAAMRVLPGSAIKLAVFHFSLSRQDPAWVAVVGWAVFATAVLLTRYSLRIDKDRRVLWLALGTLLALIPAAGALPTSRVCFFPSLGGAAVVSAWIHHAFARCREAPQGWQLAFARTWAATLAATHLVVAPVVLVYNVRYAKHYGDAETARYDHLAKTAACAEGSTENVVVVTTSESGIAQELQLRGLRHVPWWVVWPNGDDEYALTRTAPNRIELAVHHVAGEAQDGDLPHGFHPGDSFQLPAVTIEILEVMASGEVNKVAATFSKSLSDPSVCLVAWNRGSDAFASLTLPAVGVTVTLPRPAAAPPQAPDEYVDTQWW